MEPSMTPSTERRVISAGQIGKMNEILAARCRKNEHCLPSNIVQDILQEDGDELAQEQFLALRSRVELRMGMIFRHVKIDRTKTPFQMFEALRRRQYDPDNVLAMLPTEGRDEEDVCFFPGRSIHSAEQLIREYECYGLVPDWYAQMQVNIDDHGFAGKYPNMSQQKDIDGRYRYIACYDYAGQQGGRDVAIGNDHDYNPYWWYSGVRKRT